MRKILAVGMLLATAGVAYADCRPSGSADVLTVSDWSVDVSPDRMGTMTAKVSVELTSVEPKAIRMAEGVIVFSDALGGYIANIDIDRDIKIPPSGAASWLAEYGGTDLDRIPTLERDQLSVVACVSSILFDDGTVEKFE